MIAASDDVRASSLVFYAIQNSVSTYQNKRNKSLCIASIWDTENSACPALSKQSRAGQAHC